jgi:CheY-like chemotaxis protein
MGETGGVILSVDDDAVNQTVIEILLEGSGYKVIQAMDGVEALEVLESMSVLPDLILLDVMMPRMSGYEVCRKVRELYPPYLPIIMISAKSSKEDIIKGFECQCNDYVTKPFDKEELLARIEILLKLNKMRAEQHHSECIKALRKIALPRSLPSDLSHVIATSIIADESTKAFLEFLARKFELICIPNRLGGVFTAIGPNSDLSHISPFLLAIGENCEPHQRIICIVASGACKMFPYATESNTDIVPSLVLYGPVMDDINRLLGESSRFTVSGGAILVTTSELSGNSLTNGRVLLRKGNLIVHSLSSDQRLIMKEESEAIPVRPVLFDATEVLKDSGIDELRGRKLLIEQEVQDRDDYLQVLTDFCELEDNIARLKAQVVNLESEYQRAAFMVNEKLKKVLETESLNELLFLEVKRRQFELGSSSYF